MVSRLFSLKTKNSAFTYILSHLCFSNISCTIVSPYSSFSLLVQHMKETEIVNFLFFLTFHGNSIFSQMWRHLPTKKKPNPTLASSFKKYLGYLPFSHLDHEKYSEIPIPTLIWHITSKSYCSPWHRCLGGVIALNCLLSAEYCVM